MPETYLPEIVEYLPKYQDQVEKLVMNLEKFYPTIKEWLVKEIKKINERKDYCLIVLDRGKDKVGGVAISGFENPDSKLVKLKTFYLSEEFQGYAIGVLLLKKVLNYWLSKEVRRIFVTFAEEELDELKSFFDKFGFLVDGISPQHYRPEKTEYWMSKTFVYNTIDENSFGDFVRNYLLRMRGIIPTSTGLEFVAEEDNRLSKTPRKVYVKITTEEQPDGNLLFDYMNQKITETKSAYGILVSYYPLMKVSEDDRLKIIDGHLLENIFFPLQLKRQGSPHIMLPIDEEYAKVLLNLEEPQKRLVTKRVSITHEKIYYTGKNDFNDVLRGGTFIFYQTKDISSGGIIGEAKIKLLDTDTANNLISKYGFRGVFSSKEGMMPHSKGGKLSAFILANVKKYPEKIATRDIYRIISNPDFRCQPLNDKEINQIRELGKNVLNSY